MESAVRVSPIPVRDDPVRRSAAAALTEARTRRPGLPAAHVPRARLVALLEEAVRAPLVVVSAPAGTGKTTLAAEWAAAVADRRPVGWVTYEPGDTDVWQPVVECLARLGLDLPTTSGGAPGAERRRPTELAGALLAQPEPVTLVLDGIELLDPDVAHDVDVLLRHAADRLHLVLLGRVDPLLPLYRYRLEGTVAEIRIADLAFEPAETACLLQQLGVQVSDAAVDRLTQRAKGWAAGLRFAARALAGRDDAEELVGSVVASTGDIHAYLLGEVLDAQPPVARKLLLDTCVPDVLWPGLVEALGGPRGSRMLAALARSTAFLEPVPDQPGSFRYYPFFRDLLRAQLAFESPRSWIRQHRRAARWMRWHGLPVESLDLLARIGDWEAVAGQVVEESLWGEVVLAGASSGLGRVVAALPADRRSAEALLVRAAAALGRGDLPLAQDCLARAGQAPDQRDRHAAVRLGLSVLEALAVTADGPRANELADDAELALALTPWQVAPERVAELTALAQLATGGARARRGDLGSARESLSAAATGPVGARYPGFRAECLARLALVDAWDGHLARAVGTASEALFAAESGCARGEPGAGDVPSDEGRGPAEQLTTATPPDVVGRGGEGDRTVPARLALARVELDRGRLPAARRRLSEAARSRATVAHDPLCAATAEDVVAALQVAGGQGAAARGRLEEAAGALARTDPWLADTLRVRAARLQLAAGLAGEALSAVDDLDREHPEATVLAAAALVELGDVDGARERLERPVPGPVPLAVQVSRLLVEAALERRRGSRARSRAVLERAVRLAAREQLVRPLRDGSPSVRQLLAGEPRLVEDLLATSGAGVPRQRAPGRRAPAARASVPAPAARIVEPLTPKELEVLGHLESLLTTEEIADKMFISVNTVRTHVRSILRKLGVTRRNAAVRSARELGILSA